MQMYVQEARLLATVKIVLLLHNPPLQIEGASLNERCEFGYCTVFEPAGSIE
jgi:hypothetical protein